MTGLAFLAGRVAVDGVTQLRGQAGRRSTRRRRGVLECLLLASLALAGPTAATTGIELQGHIRDDFQQPVAGALVTLVDVAENVEIARALGFRCAQDES